MQVANVSEDGAGFEAKLKGGDKLLSVDGATLTDWNHFVDVIQSSANRQLAVNVERENRIITLLVNTQA